MGMVSIPAASLSAKMEASAAPSVVPGGTTQGTLEEPTKMIESPFDPKTASWEIPWPGRVAKHDLVYLTPPSDPMQGLPLGNGDIGILCWTDDTKLVFAANKCDLWDDAAFGRFHNWRAEEEEFSTALRHACRLIVDFQMPVFDVFYLSDFNARLNLADATMTLTSLTPLGAVSARAFVDHDTGLFCCEIMSKLNEDVPVNVTLERYGSRTFSHWYALVNRDSALGIKGSQAAVDDAGAYLTHQLTNGDFAAGCHVAGRIGATPTYTRLHSHAARIAVTGDADKTFDILLAVTSPLREDPIPEVKRALTAAREKGISQLAETHAAAWKTFWGRSLMEFGDDYLDNLWHLAMYYANASQRGAYPGRFINGLWGWNRDVQNWNFCFHWNQQEVYWPLNAAGHHELVDSYLKYRFNALPYGQQDAREAFHADGAIVSDVCERRGYNSASEFHNHTPVAQIAMDFWRQYRFTGSREFLKTRALPYLLEAARFFESLFERGADGAYHAKSGTGYEGWILLRDAITELVYGRVLFATALAALAEAGVEEPRATTWKTMLDNLAPLPVIKAAPELIAHENGTWSLTRALFKGEAVFSEDVFAAGFGLKENRLLTSFVANDDPPNAVQDPFEMVQALEWNKTPYSGIPEDMKCYAGIFPWVEFAPVFPSGLIGLADRDSAPFKTAVNTAKAFGVAGMGWDPLPIVLARLGLSDELARVLALWPGRWQFYCNGFGHYGPRDIMKADAALRFRTTLVKDASLPKADRDQAQFPFPAWPFRHMGMESMSVLACAMNEALLQSHDGVIRVAPAARHRNARFTLHATDGFVVSAEIGNGEVRWVCVVSRLGKTCRFESPWKNAYVFTNGHDPRSLEEGLAEFPTGEGDVIMIVPNPEALKKWNTTPIAYGANQNSKTDSAGKATLGLPRMF
ncbi:MAG: hypothetical protein HY706_12560 [Candidatus Hydrogenedentes bacterium]|nr:hypothetical protein [Candidatus Hydrogenedentota bacterium]